MDYLIEDHQRCVEARNVQQTYMTHIAELRAEISRLTKELDEARKANEALLTKATHVPTKPISSVERCRHNMVPTEGLKLHGRGELECSKCGYSRYVGPN